MKQLNILIVEDEFITLDNLKETVIDLGYIVSGIAMNAAKAIDILNDGNTDFAILDINLKGKNDGIWIANEIRTKYHIPFIFITAFTDSETIQRAVKTKPLGYLVKPFTQPSVYAAIEIAFNTFTSPLEMDSLENEHIFVNENKVFKKVYLKDIRYIEAFKNYLEINLITGRHVIRSTLKSISQQLPDQHFIQCHRSFIINKNYIQIVSKNNIQIAGQEIPFTRSFKENVMNKLKL